MTTEQQLQAQITALLAERAELIAQQPKPKGVTLKVGAKGGVSLYGMGKFPLTLYASQWKQVLNNAKNIEDFLQNNSALLSSKT